MKKTAIITGLTGQDGSYLAELLLGKDYRVYGLKRRTSSHGLGCAEHLVNDVEVVEGDLEDLSSLTKLCKTAQADEFYNLAAQSHVGTSFDQPHYTGQVTGLGVLNCLEAIRLSGYHTRFLQASTSELFGIRADGFNELMDIGTTPFHPRSPYGCAKLYGYWITVNYRESYKMFAVNSVCFNHESPRRGPNFVTRKIAIAVARIKYGLQDQLGLGNLSAARDWGHAKDYVRGMWLMLQHHHAEDFVLATGNVWTVGDFCRKAFQHVGLDYHDYVQHDANQVRPADVVFLRGDYSRAKLHLGWEPTVTFDQLVAEMVDAELQRHKPEASVCSLI